MHARMKRGPSAVRGRGGPESGQRGGERGIDPTGLDGKYVGGGTKTTKATKSKETSQQAKKVQTPKKHSAGALF